VFFHNNYMCFQNYAPRFNVFLYIQCPLYALYAVLDGDRNEECRMQRIYYMHKVVYIISAYCF